MLLVDPERVLVILTGTNGYDEWGMALLCTSPSLDHFGTSRSLSQNKIFESRFQIGGASSSLLDVAPDLPLALVLETRGADEEQLQKPMQLGRSQLGPPAFQ